MALLQQELHLHERAGLLNSDVCAGGKKTHEQSTESCISECSMTCNVLITYGSFFLNLQPLE